jgi:hypothetical protein
LEDEMNPEPMLRRVLVVNAVSSAAVAAAFLAGGHPLGRLFGVAPAVLWVMGAGLAAFGLHLRHVARKPRLSRNDALYFAVCDAAWVLASAAVLLGWPHVLSGYGRLFFALVADVVAVFCVLEFVAWRRLSAPLRQAAA